MFNAFVLKRKVCNSCGELATFCCPKCRIRLCYKCNVTLILENLKKIDTCFKCGGKQVISIACVIRFCFSEKCAKITIYFFESNFEIRERSRGVGRRWADRAASRVFINFSIGTLSDKYDLTDCLFWIASNTSIWTHLIGWELMRINWYAILSFQSLSGAMFSKYA